MATPYDIFRLATVASTQDEARELAADSSVPSLVVASEQLSGRGRQGRSWTQPDRGMFASLAFVSDWAPPEQTLIPLTAAVAARKAVANRFETELELKWPNDLMLDGQKVGGILVELSGHVVVVGCGMNLWWADPVDGAASLLHEDPGMDAAPRLAESWAGLLLAFLEDGPQAWPRGAYERASVTLSHDVYWDDGHGRAVAIAADGALVVDVDGVDVVLHSGEVHTRDRR
jgi:BirA family biotin operon repressor/biotin-[acetyl-CoA-carboxylase] ligase